MKLKTVFVLPDCHIPYHDKQVWACCLATIKAVQPHTVIVIGDFLDAYPVSTFPKDPGRRPDLKFEIDAANKALDQLQRVTGKAEIFYTEGNHEHRLTKYIARQSPELFGLLSVPQLLHVRDRGIQWVPYGRHMSVGKVSYCHDVGRAGKNAIAQSLQDFGHSIVIGHVHKLGTAYCGTVRGERHVAASVGWAGDFSQIDYRHQAMAKRDWQHGFGLIHYLRNGVGFVQAIPIIKGVAVVDGVKVSG